MEFDRFCPARIISQVFKLMLWLALELHQNQLQFEHPKGKHAVFNEQLAIPIAQKGFQISQKPFKGEIRKSMAKFENPF